MNNCRFYPNIDGKKVEMDFDRFRAWLHDGALERALPEYRLPVKASKAAEPVSKPVESNVVAADRKPQTQVSTERGTKAGITPRVIEAKDILNSFDPDYPQEFQPRDRSRRASKSQVSDIANKLNPEFLGDSPKASDGRPLVVPVEVNGETKYAVISGNARSEAIRRAYDNDSAPGKAYSEFAGGKTGDKFEQPVYVGVLDPKTDLVKFSREANESGVAAKSPTEQANIDAEHIDSDLLSRFVPSEDGTVTTAANRDFIRAFVNRAVPEAERNALMQADGRLSRAGEQRVQNAILAKTYGPEIVERVAESTDSNVRRVTTALLQTAGKMLALKQAIADGVRFPGLDITRSLVKAVDKLSFLREEGTSVEEYLKQQALFGDDLTPLERRMLAEFDNYKNSTRAVAGILDNYIAFAEALGNPKEGNLFGEPVDANAATLFKEAVLQYEKGNESEAAQSSLLDADQGRKDQSEAPKASETAGAEDLKTSSSESEADRRLSAGRESSPVIEKLGKGAEEEAKPSPPDIFAENKIFTADRVAAARELLKKRSTQFNAGLDAEQLKALVEIGGAYVEAGVRNFAAFSKALLGEFGNDIKPYLEDVYQTLRDRKEFSYLAEIPAKRAENLDKLVERVTSPDGEKTGEEAVMSVSSIKNQSVDLEREKRGLPPAMETARRDFGTVWDEAMKTIDRNPFAQTDLVEELKQKPRALTDAEDALLLHRQIELQNEYQKTMADLAEAADKGDEGRAAELNLQAARISDDLLEIYEIGRRAGTESARGLNARKLLVKEDFSLASMEMQKRAANGGRALTAEERDALKTRAEELQKKNEELQKRLEQRDEEIARLRARREITPMIREAHGISPVILDAAEKLVKRLDTRADAARERLKKRGYQFNAGLDPRDLRDLAEIGLSYLGHTGLDFARWSDAMIGEFSDAIRPHLEKIYDSSRKMLDRTAPDKRIKEAATKPKDRKPEDIRQDSLDKIKDKLDDGDRDISPEVQTLAKQFVAEGEKTVDGLVDKVHKALETIDPNITRREAMDAISGYGKFKRAAKNDLQNTLADLKGQMKQIAALEDMADGKAPAKSETLRREPSAAEKELRKKVEEAKRRGNFNVTDPETARRQALASAKTRLEKTIRDLDEQIKSGQRFVKGKKDPVTSPEIEALKKTRDELQKKFDEAFGTKEMSDPERLKTATAAVKRSIEDIEKRIAEKNFESSKPKTVTSPELEALRKKRDALRAKYDEMRAAAGGKEKTEAERLKAATDAVTRSIEDLEKRIAEKNFDTKNAKPVTSPELETLRAKRDALRADYENLRAAADPERPYRAALKAWKTRAAAQIADLQARLASGNFEPKPKKEPLLLDAEGNKIKAEIERLKTEFQSELAKDRLARRTKFEKTLDLLAKWRRGFILSSPVVLAKLTTAAIQRMTTYPLEELVGTPYSWIFRGVAAKTERAGGINVRAEAKAITAAFTTGMRDAWETLKSGHSEISLLHGKSEFEGDKSVMDYFGYMHGALKAPVKRAEFTRSFEKRIAKLISAGVDVSDPMVQAMVATKAYEDANRAIFMQDNRVVNAFKRAVNSLEAPDPKTGKVSTGGKILATTAKILLPIVKIPTNVVAETAIYVVGVATGSYKLARAYAKGIENLKPEEADIIMRHLQKGSVGLSFLALGFFNPQSFGGYYQPGQKRDEKDVKFGSVRVFGVDLPSYLVHNPLLEVLQLGATIRRVADSKMKKKDKETQGITSGVVAGGLGLVEEVPFVKESVELSKALEPRQRKEFAGEFLKGLIVPQIVSWAATRTDKKTSQTRDLLFGEPVKRDPETIWQHIETGVPGLRQNVPKKKK